MKKLIVGLAGVAGGLAMFATSGSVMAAGVYTLQDVGSWNTYTLKTPTAIPTLTGGPIPFGGTATSTGANFTATGVQFSFTNSNATFNYTNGSWSGAVTLGGSVSHSEFCTQGPGTACTSPVSGLTGVWATGLQNNGAADTNNCYGATSSQVPGAAPPVCNAVSVTENPGVSLVVWESSAVAAPYTGSGSRYCFGTGAGSCGAAAVPVPAAVWLFGSGLGLLGWVRRRAAK
jgi:hypothetical protein